MVCKLYLNKAVRKKKLRQSSQKAIPLKIQNSTYSLLSFVYKRKKKTEGKMLYVHEIALEGSFH